jgi:hypothetical protein
MHRAVNWVKTKIKSETADVLPLPREEGWGEGEFTLSSTLSIPLPHYSTLPNLT